MGGQLGIRDCAVSTGKGRDAREASMLFYRNLVQSRREPRAGIAAGGGQGMGGRLRGRTDPHCRRAAASCQ